MCFITENEAVSLISMRLALACGLGAKKAEKIKIAASLHDVGKKFTPAHILNKPSKLTEDEFSIIKRHTKDGFAMLSYVSGEIGIMARATALLHHEHFDGGGYWGIQEIGRAHV